VILYAASYAGLVDKPGLASKQLPVPLAIIQGIIVSLLGVICSNGNRGLFVPMVITQG
jgi:hypothetical protein